MLTRTRSVVLVAVLALLVGVLVGASASAGASALSAKTVRKIAAKVVTKKAKHLTVAHAATADSATTAASSERVKGHVFTLPSQLNALSRHFAFPGLPAGTYLASYGLTANIPTGATFTCQFQPDTGATAAPSYDQAVANLATAEGSSIVAVAGTFHLACTGSSTWGVNPYYGATVSFVPVTAAAATQATGS